MSIDLDGPWTLVRLGTDAGNTYTAPHSHTREDTMEDLPEEVDTAFSWSSTDLLVRSIAGT